MTDCEFDTCMIQVLQYMGTASLLDLLVYGLCSAVPWNTLVPPDVGDIDDDLPLHISVSTP